MNLSQSVQSFIQALTAQNAKPLYEQTPEQARHVLSEAQKNQKSPPAEVTYLTLNLRNSTPMRVLIVRPNNKPGILPVIYYIHGGGWVMGDAQTHDRLIRDLAIQTEAAVVFPVYTPSPEAKYPNVTDDLFHVLEQIVQQAPAYGLDASRVAVAGDSVGGNMAAVMAMKAKASQAVKLVYQALLYPVTSAEMTTESYRMFENGPWLTQKAMAWFWEQYAPESISRSQKDASILNASLEDLKGLPPALVITDENDVLRDEGEAYARRLDEAGVPTVNVRFNGTIHDFMMLDALSETPQSKTAVLLTAACLKQAFMTQ